MWKKKFLLKCNSIAINWYGCIYQHSTQPLVMQADIIVGLKQLLMNCDPWRTQPYGCCINYMPILSLDEGGGGEQWWKLPCSNFTITLHGQNLKKKKIFVPWSRKWSAMAELLKSASSQVYLKEHASGVGVQFRLVHYLQFSILWYRIKCWPRWLCKKWTLSWMQAFEGNFVTHTLQIFTNSSCTATFS